MKRRGLWLSAMALAMSGLLLTGCTSEGASSTPETADLDIVGSASQAAGVAGLRAGFRSQEPGTTVVFEERPSGGEIEALTTDRPVVAAVDRPLTSGDWRRVTTACRAYPIGAPVWADSVAVVYNLDGVGELHLSNRSLVRIFSGAATMWDDPSIHRDNPTLDLPGQPLTLVGYAASTGVDDALRRHLAATQPKPRVRLRPADVRVDDALGMAEAIAETAGAIGVMESRFSGQLGRASLQSDTAWVLPTPETSSEALATATWAPNRGGLSVLGPPNRSDTSGGYPILVVSYLVACPAGDGSALSRRLLAFALSKNGQRSAADPSGSVPLPGELALQLREVLQGR